MRQTGGPLLASVLGAPLSVAAWAVLIGLCMAVVVTVSLRLGEFLPSLGSVDRRVLGDAAGMIWRTLYYATASSVLQVLLGLMAALSVHWASRGWLKPVFVTILLAPYATPSALIGMVYRFLFGMNGDVPRLFERWFDTLPETWYVLHPVTASVAASVWQFFPFSFLLLYVALAGTPTAQLKSARLDGAPFWVLTWRIVLRRILPVLLAVFVLRFIFMLVKFDTPYIFTEAGLASPADVATVEIYAAFRGSTTFIAAGESIAALAVFLIAAVGAFTYAWLTRTGEHKPHRRGP